MPQVFFPRSIDFVKKSAKQLQAAFPGLRMATAQEGVAQALGFKSWFDCQSRLASGKDQPSPSDENLPHVLMQVSRRYQQITGLVDGTGLPAVEVEDFVRRWNLTADAPGRLGEFQSAYAAMEEALGSTDPSTAAKQVADGVLLGPVGRHQYYTLSTARTLAVPYFLRGNLSVHLAEENCLAPGLPEVFGDEAELAQVRWLQATQPWLFEWLTGDLPAGAKVPLLGELQRCAEDDPAAWYPLAIRLDLRDRAHPKLVAPCVQGQRFSDFLRHKGQVSLRRVGWFRISEETAARIEAAVTRRQPAALLTGLRIPKEEVVFGVPLYASPFKHGPMRREEYVSEIEGSALPLSAEWEAAGVTVPRVPGEEIRPVAQIA